MAARRRMLGRLCCWQPCICLPHPLTDALLLHSSQPCAGFGCASWQASRCPGSTTGAFLITAVGLMMGLLLPLAMPASLAGIWHAVACQTGNAHAALLPVKQAPKQHTRLMLTAVPCPASADLPSISVTPRHTYNAPLSMVLRALAHMRAGGALLHAAEWRMYAAALAAGSVAARMAVAATVAGNAEEVSVVHTNMQVCGCVQQAIQQIATWEVGVMQRPVIMCIGVHGGQHTQGSSSCW